MELEATGERARSNSGILAGGDRLSALPDCLIHHIMSFMKAWQVVQTCVLSTWWRHLWRSVPCLDFDIEEFNTADENHDSDEEWEKFEDFTDHLLTNNIAIALLDTFQLHVGDRYHRDELAARWIRHGIKYSAQAPGGIQLDRGLWRLKRLHLSHVHLDDRFAKHVSKGCRSLEDLELSGCLCEIREITSHSVKNMVLKDCTWIGLSAITSPALKSLVIDGGSISGPSSTLVITAPAVAYLLIMALWSCSFVAGISINEMPSLVKASIELRVGV